MLEKHCKNAWCPISIEFSRQSTLGNGNSSVSPVQQIIRFILLKRLKVENNSGLLNSVDE